MKRYEGLFILNLSGKEEGVKDALDKISTDITAAGGKVETVQKMEKKAFARVADKKHSAGFYANVIFAGTPAIIAQLHDEVRAERGSVPRAVHLNRRSRSPRNNSHAFMASFNKVILMGNLTRDPELRYTPKGTAIAKVGLAVNRVWTNEAGEKKEEVTFVDVDVFGRTAENVGQYMRKGRPILVEGRLKLDQWDDKQTGQKKSKLGVVAETVQFLGSAPGAGEGGAPAAPRRRPSRRRAQRARRPNPWKATARPKATTFRSDFLTAATKIIFVWQKLKSSSRTTSSASAVNPTRSASPPATRAIICFRRASPCP